MNRDLETAQIKEEFFDDIVITSLEEWNPLADSTVPNAQQTINSSSLVGQTPALYLSFNSPSTSGTNSPAIETISSTSNISIKQEDVGERVTIDNAQQLVNDSGNIGQTDDKSRNITNDHQVTSGDTTNMFKCNYPECGKRFKHRKHLIRHNRVHTGEKPHKCTWKGCNRRFIRKEHLKIHSRVHTGEKPFKCTGCSEAFARADKLNEHERTCHTNDRRYICHWAGCEGKFAIKYHLDRHIRTHTGEKPFVCDRCGGKFSRNEHLIRHRKNVHKQ